MAIVQLVPNIAAADAGQNGAELLVGPRQTHLSKPLAIEPGEISMETIIRDGGSSRVIAMFADTQRQKISPVATAAPDAYDFVNPAIDAWARQIVAVIANTPGTPAR
jgi:hypothetical protein